MRRDAMRQSSRQVMKQQAVPRATHSPPPRGVRSPQSQAAASASLWSMASIRASSRLSPCEGGHSPPLSTRPRRDVRQPRQACPTTMPEWCHHHHHHLLLLLLLLLPLCRRHSPTSQERCHFHCHRHRSRPLRRRPRAAARHRPRPSRTASGLPGRCVSMVAQHLRRRINPTAAPPLAAVAARSAKPRLRARRRRNPKRGRSRSGPFGRVASE